MSLEQTLQEHIQQVLQDLQVSKKCPSNLYNHVMQCVEAVLISEALKHSKTQIQAAELLGINRSVLYQKIKKNQLL